MPHPELFDRDFVARPCLGQESWQVGALHFLSILVYLKKADIFMVVFCSSALSFRCRGASKLWKGHCAKA